MKKFLTFIMILICFCANAQSVKLISWNIQNLGESKDSNELAYITSIVKDYDIISIQEVGTGEAGVKAVNKLTKMLSSYGCWVNIISKATSGEGSERYAYVFNIDKVFFTGLCSLDDITKDCINREPFLAMFEKDDFRFMLVNFHAVPSNKNPEKEISLLYKIDSTFKKQNIIFMGDFNLSQKEKAFSTLKTIGYMPSLINTKTSLRSKEDGASVFSEEYDNFFYEAKNFIILESCLIDITKDFKTLKDARSISDHCPISIEYQKR